MLLLLRPHGVLGHPRRARGWPRGIFRLDGQPRMQRAQASDSSGLGAVDGLGLGVERLALRRLAVDGHEAAHAERLLGLLDGSEPALDVGETLLARRRLVLRDDLATLVLEELGLG